MCQCEWLCMYHILLYACPGSFRGTDLLSFRNPESSRLGRKEAIKGARLLMCTYMLATYLIDKQLVKLVRFCIRFDFFFFFFLPALLDILVLRTCSDIMPCHAMHLCVSPLFMEPLAIPSAHCPVPYLPRT